MAAPLRGRRRLRVVVISQQASDRIPRAVEVPDVEIIVTRPPAHLQEKPFRKKGGPLDGPAPLKGGGDDVPKNTGAMVTGWQGTHHLRTQSPSFPNLTVWFINTVPSGNGGSISTVVPLMTPRFLCFLGLFATVSMKSIMQPFCSI